MLRALAVGFCLLLGAVVDGWRGQEEACVRCAVDDETLEQLKKHRLRIIAEHLVKIERISAMGNAAIASHRATDDFDVAERTRLAEEAERACLGQRLKEYDRLVARLHTHRQNPTPSDRATGQ